MACAPPQEEIALETFKPSMDWAHELGPSLLWIGQAWAISAVVTMVLLVVLARYTVWGRQYWRITGDYFKGGRAWVHGSGWRCCCSPRSSRFGLTSCSATTATTCSHPCRSPSRSAGAGNEEIRQSGIHGFWQAIIIFAILATIYISRVMLDIYFTQRFIIRWRVWLTDRLT